MHREIDRHWDKTSPLHRMDGRVRIPAVGVWAVALCVLGSPWMLAAGLVLAAGMARMACIPAREIAGRAGGAAVLLSPLLLVFPLVAEPGERAEALLRAASMLLRGCALVLLTFPVFNTARFHETMGSCRALGVPAKLVSIVLLAYRAVFVFFEDLRRMQVAAVARAWRHGGGPRTLALCAGHMGSLLVRSIDRTETLWHAMRLRGYTGEFPEARRIPLGAGQWLGGAALAAAPMALVLAERLAT